MNRLARSTVPIAQATFGPLDPAGPGPVRAEVFESWEPDEDCPVELIAGWVLPMTPGNFETGHATGDLYAILQPLLKRRRWSVSLDARHRLPRPRNTVVFPDIAIHAVDRVDYIPGTETVARVPEIVIEFLGKQTHERDIAPRGANFLAYQASGVREYYYAWPDGREAAGFSLRGDIFAPLLRARGGWFSSPLLQRRLRLVEAGLKLR